MWVDGVPLHEWRPPSGHLPLSGPTDPFWISLSVDKTPTLLWMQCACGHTESGEDHDVVQQAAWTHAISCPSARTAAPLNDWDDDCGDTPNG